MNRERNDRRNDYPSATFRFQIELTSVQHAILGNFSTAC
jgi:hypothetical protein